MGEKCTPLESAVLKSDIPYACAISFKFHYSHKSLSYLFLEFSSEINGWPNETFSFPFHTDLANNLFIKLEQFERIHEDNFNV